MGYFEPIQEIVDLIVDHLFDIIQESRNRDYLDDHRLLEFKKIALINKSFGSSCQKYLFSSVDLHKNYDSQLGEDQSWEPELDEIDQQIVLNLVTIFREKPHLAAHLRTFTICMHFGNLVKRYETLATLLSLLQPYGNPRNLNMITSAMDYKDHGPYPDSSIFQHLRVQHMKCDVFQKMPASIIANNRELKSLELVFCRWKPDADDVNRIDLTARPAIKRLTVGGSLGLLGYLIEPKVGSPSILDFSSLEYLCINCEAADRANTVQRLLRFAAKSLKECTIFTNVNNTVSYDANFNFSSCTNLRTVCLRTMAPSLDYITNGQRIMNKLVTMLGTISNPNFVDMLEITFHHDLTRGYDALEMLSWESLDQEIHRLLSASHSSKPHAACSLYFLFDMETEEYVDTESVAQTCLQFVGRLKPRFQSTVSNERIKFEIKQDLTISDGICTIFSSKTVI